MSHTLIIVALLIVAAILCRGCNAVPTSFTRKRKQPDPSNKPRVNDMGITLSAVANKLRVVCAESISMNGIPQIVASGGAHVGDELPTACTMINPTTFDLTYTHSVATDDAITVPTADPAARGRTGAYIAATTTVVP
jgi:hypothetical protein